jgi:hypothetical protein
MNLNSAYLDVSMTLIKIKEFNCSLLGGVVRDRSSNMNQMIQNLDVLIMSQSNILSSENKIEHDNRVSEIMIRLSGHYLYEKSSVQCDEIKGMFVTAMKLYLYKYSFSIEIRFYSFNLNEKYSPLFHLCSCTYDGDDVRLIVDMLDEWSEESLTLGYKYTYLELNKFYNRSYGYFKTIWSHIVKFMTRGWKIKCNNTIFYVYNGMIVYYTVDMKIRNMVQINPEMDVCSTVFSSIDEEESELISISNQPSPIHCYKHSNRLVTISPVNI